MSEMWRRVPGWRWYEVSDLGRVRSLPHKLRDGRRAGGIILAHDITGSGYPRVTLSRNGRQVKEYVHRLVMLAFTGPCPPGMEIRHLNGNPLDPRLVNLCYGSHRENVQDQAVHGTNGRGLTAEAVREMRTLYATDSRQTYDSLAAAYGVSRQTVRMVLLRRTWAHVDAPAGPRPPRAFAKPHAKLTDDQVLEIRLRAARGEMVKSLAPLYGVTPSTIGQIVRGETWVHVGGLRETDDEEKQSGQQQRDHRQGNAVTPETSELPYVP